MNKVFKNVGTARVRRSLFNLSYSKLLDADMGILYPVQIDEVVPGDIFDMAVQAVIRANPMVAPVYHQIDVTFHTFFWPYRLSTDSEGTFDWEKFITGDVDGEDAQTLPTWQPTDFAVQSLWDYMGFPAGVDPDGAYPVDFPRQAYNAIYNEFYRDETLIAELAFAAEDLQIRAWEKDYFTSCLPWQQRGIAPALPLSGTTNAEFPGDITSSAFTWPAISAANMTNMVFDSGAIVPYNAGTKGTLEKGEATIAEADLDTNVVDFADATTFDVADLRLAFQIQKWMERNARAGARYTEFLLAHFGRAPKDERLDRPEYIGGAKFPVIVSEVLQTSETAGTAQGTLAGHGIGVDRTRIGRYRVSEYGLIMTIMSIMPKPMYSQGINKQWLKETRYDFYFPEFAHLSEQAVIQAEIYADGVPANNTTLFGYQGRYDEMRVKQNMTVGLMNTDFDYWHIGRQFGGAPTLDQTFIECVPRKDFLASVEDPAFVVSVGNIIKAVRPLPIIAEPGYIDH